MEKVVTYPKSIVFSFVSIGSCLFFTFEWFEELRESWRKDMSINLFNVILKNNFV